MITVGVAKVEHLLFIVTPYFQRMNSFFSLRVMLISFGENISLRDINAYNRVIHRSCLGPNGHVHSVTSVCLLADTVSMTPNVSNVLFQN